MTKQPTKAPAKKAPAKKAPAKKANARLSTAASTATAGATPLDKFLVQQRASLIADRASHTEQADKLQEEADQLAAEREPGDVQFDEESGEGDTLAVERERDLALSAQARAAIEEIDGALERIDAGTYGICQQCGERIPKERLKAIPYARLCVRCKSGGLGRR
ncbi:MAG: TraR/DksA family transcriptional regulator [Acidimicrobiales bacterium]